MIKKKGLLVGIILLSMVVNTISPVLTYAAEPSFETEMVNHEEKDSETESDSKSNSLETEQINNSESETERQSLAETEQIEETETETETDTLKESTNKKEEVESNDKEIITFKDFLKMMGYVFRFFSENTQCKGENHISENG